MKKQLLSSLSIILALTSAISSSAYGQVKDKKFKHWTTYTTTLDGKRTCYMASSPVSKTGNYTRRDEPYFLVTRISGDTYEVSTSSGYKYKSSSEVKAEIDDKTYKMFTKGELAWAYNEGSQDSVMIGGMKKGNFLKVRGTSTKGTYSIDKYSLSGFTAAYDRVKSLCSNNS